MVAASSQPDTIDIVVSLDDTVQDGEKGIFSRTMAPSVTAVPLSALKESFFDTLEALRRIFSELPDLDTLLPLQDIQVTFEVTTSGRVALLGTSAELAGRGAIAMTFTRRTTDGH
jgi:hypothetical protein